MAGEKEMIKIRNNGIMKAGLHACNSLLPANHNILTIAAVAGV